MTTQRRPLVIAALIGLITPAVVSATGPVGFSHCTRTMDPPILTAPIDRSRLVTIAQIKASSRHEDLVYLKGRPLLRNVRIYGFSGRYDRRQIK